MNRQENARHKLVRARSELVLEMPFFAHLALRLNLRPDPSCVSAWTNGSDLAFNPGYVEALPLPKLKGMLCHEVLHLACLHHTRRGERDKSTWNRACDYAINPILLDAGLELPNGYLDDPRHHGKSAEEIYWDLRDVDREEHEFVTENPNLGEKSTPAEGASSSSISHEGEESAGERSDQTSEAQENNGNGPTPAGDGAPESRDRESDPGADPGMTGEVRDADQSGGAHAESLHQEQEQLWSEAVSRATQRQQEAGDLPGALARLLEDRFAPTLSWHDLLQRFLSRAARNDFSWVRPNRRHLHTGLYLPGLHTEELDDVAVVLDVSGSVDEECIQGFMAELTGMLEDFDMTATLITCDAAVTQVRPLTRADLPVCVTATGGGGTDFRPPFQWLGEQSRTPACLIYFTDMNCNRYPQEPDFPVLWVTPSIGTEEPPFGELIYMEESLCA